tara:strand:+ start:183 stop:707 length:525 start_codon:yes stop_codon:yes gene_type:complete
MAEVYDEFSAPPAGHSLTEDNTRWPWGRPPENTDPDRVMSNMIKTLMKPRNKNELLKLLMTGVSIEVIVEGMIFTGFRDGKFSPDVGLLLKGHLAIMIADIAEQENVPYRMFENDNPLEEDEMDDATFLRMMKQNNPRMFAEVRRNINAAIRAGNRPQLPEEDNFMNMSRKENE